MKEFRGHMDFMRFLLPKLFCCILICCLSHHGITPAQCSCRQGLFTQIKGIRFLFKLQSMFECGFLLSRQTCKQKKQSVTVTVTVSKANESSF